MRIICPKCRKKITTRDRSPENDWARCIDCGIFFRFPDTRRRSVPPFCQHTVISTEDSLLIEEKWSSKNRGCFVIIICELLVLLLLLIRVCYSVFQNDLNVSFGAIFGLIFFGILMLISGIVMIAILIDIFSPKDYVLILRDRFIIKKQWFGKRWTKEYPIEKVSPVYIDKTVGDFDDYEIYLFLNDKKYLFDEYDMESVFWLAAEINHFLFSDQQDSNNVIDTAISSGNNYDGFRKIVEEYKSHCENPGKIEIPELLTLVYLYRYGRFPYGAYGDHLILHCPHCRNTVALEKTDFPGNHANRCPHCSREFTLEATIPHYHLYRDHQIQAFPPVLPHDSRFQIQFDDHATVIRIPLRERKIWSNLLSITITLSPQAVTFHKTCFGIKQTTATQTILSLKKTDFRFRKKSFFPKFTKSWFPIEVEYIDSANGRHQKLEIPCFTAYEQDWLYEAIITHCPVNDDHFKD